MKLLASPVLDQIKVTDLATGLSLGLSTLSEATAPVRAKYDLGHRGTMILNQIAGGNISPTTIAESLNISRSLLSAELSRILQAKLATAGPGKDRRKLELTLTAGGIHALEEVIVSLENLFRERLSGFSERDVATCIGMLFALGRRA